MEAQEGFKELGSFKLLCGPTGSGKSEKLRQEAGLLEYQKKQYLWAIADIPGLENSMKTAPNNGEAVAVIPPDSPIDLLNFIDGLISHVFIDNIHGFVDNSLCEVIELLMKEGIHILGAGNDIDFRGEPFNEMGTLLCISTEIEKFSARCYYDNCKNLATLTQRWIDDKFASNDSPILAAGENIRHLPVCYDHLRVPDKLVTLPSDYLRIRGDYLQASLGAVPDIGNGFNPNVKLYYIDAIVGPMCGGKTLKLISTIKKWSAHGMDYVLVKPMVSKPRGQICSRDTGEEFPTVFIDDNKPYNILEHAKDKQCIGIDEGQFFSDGIVYVLRELAQAGKHVVVSGLDMSFKREPIGSMPGILCAANDVQKVYAGCDHANCNLPARYSQRYIVTFGEDRKTVLRKEPAPYDVDTICAGTLEQDTHNYGVKCLLHSEVPNKPSKIPQELRV